LQVIKAIKLNTHKEGSLWGRQTLSLSLNPLEKTIESWRNSNHFFIESLECSSTKCSLSQLTILFHNYSSLTSNDYKTLYLRTKIFSYNRLITALRISDSQAVRMNRKYYQHPDGLTINQNREVISIIITNKICVTTSRIGLQDTDMNGCNNFQNWCLAVAVGVTTSKRCAQLLRSV